MQNLIPIILPVISQMDDQHLKTQLLGHFPRHEEQFRLIEASFQTLTAGPQPPETLHTFFHSWSQTNNSAMTVAGLSNRMTMLVHRKQPLISETALFQAVASLNRIVDEDLAVVGRVLHSSLFYTMATNISGSDDWLSHGYLRPEAKAFKAWKDENSLRKETS